MEEGSGREDGAGVADWDAVGVFVVGVLLAVAVIVVVVVAAAAAVAAPVRHPPSINFINASRRCFSMTSLSCCLCRTRSASVSTGCIGATTGCGGGSSEDGEGEDLLLLLP